MIHLKLFMFLVNVLFLQIYCKPPDKAVYCTLFEPLIAGNIKKFANCTKFEGNIEITNDTFIKMRPEQLNILKTIKRIKGMLVITAYHDDFINLNFLENLEIIESSTGKSNENAVAFERTSLQDIELPALKKIEGNIVIQGNKALCYSLQWLQTSLVNTGYVDKAITNGNKPASECNCHDQCDTEGCWGPRANQCYGCRSQTIQGKSGSTCIEDCNTNNDICKEQCTSCEGPCVQLCWFNPKDHSAEIENVYSSVIKCIIPLVVLVLSVFVGFIVFIALKYFKKGKQKKRVFRDSQEENSLAYQQDATGDI